MDRVAYETYDTIDVYDSMDVNPTEEQVISFFSKTKTKTMASVK